MQIVAFIFFLAALTLSLGVVGTILFCYRHRILEALAGEIHPEKLASADVIYLQRRRGDDIEWRRAA